MFHLSCNSVVSLTCFAIKLWTLLVDVLLIGNRRLTWRTGLLAAPPGRQHDLSALRATGLWQDTDSWSHRGDATHAALCAPECIRRDISRTIHGLWLPWSPPLKWPFWGNSPEDTSLLAETDIFKTSCRDLAWEACIDVWFSSYVFHISNFPSRLGQICSASAFHPDFRIDN